MLKIRICEDEVECAAIWQQLWPQKCFFDLWEVRKVFADSYKRDPYFILAEQGGNIEGLLALSRTEPSHSFAHFPGETWKGKTWLEQNRILSSSDAVFNVLLDNVPGPTNLRYLTRDSVPLTRTPVAVDEVGYLFYPGAYNFSFQRYLQEFSGKSRKKLGRELKKMEDMGVVYRYDNIDDIEILFQMNKKSFREASYFHDRFFLEAFKSLITWLHHAKLLRITTILLGGVVAAVDIGAVWNNSYTVLAGATNMEFPGIAKMINFHHIQWACRQHLDVVDFLCGNFGWKQRFHLTARPLYEINIMPTATDYQETEFFSVTACEQ